MAEQFLYRADIITAFQKMCGKTVAQGVAIYSFGNIGLKAGLFYGFLKTVFVDMVTARLTAPWINGKLVARKHILPAPLFWALVQFNR